VHRPVIDAREARRHRPGVEPRRLTAGLGVLRREGLTTAKLKFVAADKAGLSDDELKARPDSFYADELKLSV
jgi:hypothetical protein